MIRDEDLKNQFDYSEGQREASHRVLIELINLFDEYRDDILLVGGWVPEVMFPGEGHIGSVDVDILINHIRMKEKLSEKFASPEHAGPVDVANFMNLGNAEETAFIKRDAYELMQALLELI